MNNAAGVIVIVQEDHGSRTLKKLIRVVVVFALEESGQRTTRVQFDVVEIYWGIHVQEELTSFCIFLGPPRKVLVRRVHNTGSALLPSLPDAQNRASLSKYPRIRSKTVSAVRNG